MKTNSMLFIVAVLLLTGINGHAQQQEDLLARLQGNWYSKGMAFGMEADITMAWEPTLQGEFMKLSYKMEMKTNVGSTQVFEGTAYYHLTAPGQYAATWFDSGGEMHRITASDNGTALSAIWGTPETKLGRTVYTLIDANTVEIVDHIQRKDGTWHEFNRNTLKRVD